MITRFDKFLGQHVRVHEHQLVVELKRNPKLAALNVLESVKQNVVSVFVIAQLLLLLSDRNCDLYSLTDLAGFLIQSECVLGLFRNSVGFAHQVVYQLVRQSI